METGRALRRWRAATESAGHRGVRGDFLQGLDPGFGTQARKDHLGMSDDLRQQLQKADVPGRATFLGATRFGRYDHGRSPGAGDRPRGTALLRKQGRPDAGAAARKRTAPRTSRGTIEKGRSGADDQMKLRLCQPALPRQPRAVPFARTNRAKTRVNNRKKGGTRWLWPPPLSYFAIFTGI
jgi:hypothetical protein